MATLSSFEIPSLHSTTDISCCEHLLVPEQPLLQSSGNSMLVLFTCLMIRFWQQEAYTLNGITAIVPGLLWSLPGHASIPYHPYLIALVLHLCKHWTSLSTLLCHFWSFLSDGQHTFDEMLLNITWLESTGYKHKACTQVNPRLRGRHHVFIWISYSVTCCATPNVHLDLQPWWPHPMIWMA